MRMRKKTKGLPNYIHKISPYCKKNLFLTICELISQKPVQKRGIGEKCGFFATSVLAVAKVERLTLPRPQYPHVKVLLTG